MPSSIQNKCVLVVQPKERANHAHLPTLVLPENDCGITATRKWIWEQGKDKRYIVMDDDIVMKTRKPWFDGEKSKRTMTEDDWNHMLTETSKWMDEGVTWGGCRTGGLPPAGKEYIDNTGTAEVFFFDGKQLPSADELDWELSTAEDISLSLQLLSKGYPNRVWDRFVYLSTFIAVGDEGGCATWRTLDIINDNHAKLIEKFPEYVSYNGEKEMMNGIFTKIKIQYKKAWKQSQTTNLEEFM